MEITTRRQAREKGLKRYFLNKICPYGHNGERYVSSAKCCQCTSEFEEAWRPLNKDKAKIRAAAWDAENPERKRVNGRNYRSKNKEREKAKVEKWNAANPERRKANRARWRAESPRYALSGSLYMLLKNCPTKNPITIDELMSIFEKQQGLCALSGIKMTWSNGTKESRGLPTAVSIDRIDPSKKYTKDNVQLMCVVFNAFKRQMSMEDAIKMLLIAADYIKCQIH